MNATDNSAESDTAHRGGNQSRASDIEGVLVGGQLHLVVYGKVHAKAASDLSSRIEDLRAIAPDTVTVDIADRSLFAPYARLLLRRRSARTQTALATAPSSAALLRPSV